MLHIVPPMVSTTLGGTWVVMRICIMYISHVVPPPLRKCRTLFPQWFQRRLGEQTSLFLAPGEFCINLCCKRRSFLHHICYVKFLHMGPRGFCHNLWPTSQANDFILPTLRCTWSNSPRGTTAATSHCSELFALFLLCTELCTPLQPLHKSLAKFRWTFVASTYLDRML